MRNRQASIAIFCLMAAFENRAMLCLSPFCIFAAPRHETRVSFDRKSTRRTCASAPAEARATTTSGRRANSAGEPQRRRRCEEERRAAVDEAIEERRAFLIRSYLPLRRVSQIRQAHTRARAQGTGHAAWWCERGLGPTGRVRQKKKEMKK